jgi:hypothetical protein
MGATEFAEPKNQAIHGQRRKPPIGFEAEHRGLGKAENSSGWHFGPRRKNRPAITREFGQGIERMKIAQGGLIRFTP